jgi:hypothetical protein
MVGDGVPRDEILGTVRKATELSQQMTFLDSAKTFGSVAVFAAKHIALGTVPAFTEWQSGVVQEDAAALIERAEERAAKDIVKGGFNRHR